MWFERDEAFQGSNYICRWGPSDVSDFFPLSFPKTKALPITFGDQQDRGHFASTERKTRANVE